MTGGISLSWGDISLCLWLISVGVLFYFFKFYLPHKIKTQVEHTSKEKIERLKYSLEHTSKEKIEGIKSSFEKELTEIRHSLEIEKEKRNRVFGKMHDKRYEFYPEVIEIIKTIQRAFYETMDSCGRKEYIGKMLHLIKEAYNPLLSSTYYKSIIFLSDSELEILSKIKEKYSRQLDIFIDHYKYPSVNKIAEDFFREDDDIGKLTEELAREMRKSLFPENE